ncbi:hypothetical protein G7046_g6604 [Stylonectria norvegica]|nr:hypothetical protein G7046_g6604 [Stylonectria norvegica]
MQRCNAMALGRRVTSAECTVPVSRVQFGRSRSRLSRVTPLEKTRPGARDGVKRLLLNARPLLSVDSLGGMSFPGLAMPLLLSPSTTQLGAPGPGASAGCYSCSCFSALIDVRVHAGLVWSRTAFDCFCFGVGLLLVACPCRFPLAIAAAPFVAVVTAAALRVCRTCTLAIWSGLIWSVLLCSHLTTRMELSLSDEASLSGSTFPWLSSYSVGPSVSLSSLQMGCRGLRCRARAVFVGVKRDYYLPPHVKDGSDGMDH